ncbi:hypothetical protein CAEBREN_22931 [Caenorhabditis brenneri]|uniref:Uncharacterized protein n=1 Tax=Caenorhabditis brenneri TaxID=135651 RepID=G0PHT5_CAEBE|nr:hypothetical protein CAEBREN_22931 [Caenorhabditis brenneri]
MDFFNKTMDFTLSKVLMKCFDLADVMTSFICKASYVLNLRQKRLLAKIWEHRMSLPSNRGCHSQKNSSSDSSLRLVCNHTDRLLHVIYGTPSSKHSEDVTERLTSTIGFVPSLAKLEHHREEDYSRSCSSRRTRQPQWILPRWKRNGCSYRKKISKKERHCTYEGSLG